MKNHLTLYSYYLIILVGILPTAPMVSAWFKNKPIKTTKKMAKNKDNDKKSFVMYDSFLSAMKHLNDAEFRECVLRIRDYALEGIDEESQSPYVNIILAMAKPNLDSARRRYMASVENGKKGAEFGKLGGAPKGNQNARKNNPQSTPKQPLDVDVNDDVEDLIPRPSCTIVVNTKDQDYSKYNRVSLKMKPISVGFVNFYIHISHYLFTEIILCIVMWKMHKLCMIYKVITDISAAET